MTKPIKPISNKDLRTFGIVMAVMLCLISIIPVWKDHMGIAYGFWIVAGLFLLLGLATPFLLGPVHKYWMKFALVLGWINSRIILTLVYFSLFLPISLIQIIVGRDPMQRKIDKNINSYWIDRSKDDYNPKHFERQF